MSDTCLAEVVGGREQSIAVREGDSLVWHEPGWGRVLTATHALAVREIVAVAGVSQFGEPDSIASTLKLAAEGVLGAVPRAAGGTSALELRYVTEPQPGRPTRVRLFITAKVAAHGTPETLAADAEVAVDAACAALPSGYQHEPCDAGERTPGFDSSSTLVEVRRQEEVTPPLLCTVPAAYYYAPYPLSGDGSGWRQFLTLLARLSVPVAVSLLFSPTVLHPREQHAIGLVASELAFHAETRQEQTHWGLPRHIPGDANAAAVLPVWQHYSRTLGHCLLVRMTVRGRDSAATAVARALARGLSTSAASDTAPAFTLTTQRAVNAEDRDAAEFSWDLLEVVPWGGHRFWADDGAPHVVRRLPYLFGLSEAAAAAVLPVPEEQGAAGFARARRAATRRLTLTPRADAGAGVELGDVLHEGQPAGDMRLPLTAVNRHLLVVGAPGSGKTTTVLSLLVRLWREHRLPFLAIEPAKTEYRTLLELGGMEALRVITLGRDDVAPIRLNPLSPPPGVRAEIHQNTVMAAFRAALPLDPPLPQLLEEALQRSYRLAGWDHATTPEDGLRSPTLRDLLDAYEDGFDEHGYSGEVRDNLLAALRLRLRSLTRGSRGLLLDTVESVDFAELMSVPVIVELDQIADREDKAILAAFLLDRVRAAARARGSTRGRLAHVTVLEEAHRLLARSGAALTETPQSAAIRSFCDAIAELRALGEGFVICSQSPSALAEAAVANTGTRIIHRLESAADRDVVLADLDATEHERETAARLRRGEAIVRAAEQDELEIASVRPADGVDSGRPVDNATVTERMRDHTEAAHRLLPYKLCTRQVCSAGCSPQTRARGARIAGELGPAARAVWNEHDGHASALEPISRSVAEQANGEPRPAYCAAVHLAVQRDALMVPGKDIRPQLERAIRSAVDAS